MNQGGNGSPEGSEAQEPFGATSPSSPGIFSSKAHESLHISFQAMCQVLARPLKPSREKSSRAQGTRPRSAHDGHPPLPVGVLWPQGQGQQPRPLQGGLGTQKTGSGTGLPLMSATGV
ncbi:Hypothetical predicted protein [Marmota monax]|uniref:Uncharacterized protein n=1 Tax=Marmota monax TaxID=9995 RepID=A0A5E4CLE6_MARMO|nr:hypothetical protein GHT09_018357 [Marmota monax]VTJ81909.1 Hypothetical predicted protein [Marmota monax]